MDEIRLYIQNGLAGLTLSETGTPKPDDMIEDGETYFGYEVQETYNDSDLAKEYTMQVSIVGRLVRRNDVTGNTLSLIDEALDELKKKLKQIGFRYTCQDVSMDDNVRKIVVSGYFIYNQINKTIY